MKLVQQTLILRLATVRNTNKKKCQHYAEADSGEDDKEGARVAWRKRVEKVEQSLYKYDKRGEEARVVGSDGL